MRLLGVTIEEFRSIRGQWLPADGLVILFGPNSAGKTSVLEAASELLRAGSHLRTDPGLLEDLWAQGSVWFTLPRARIDGSGDAEFYRAFLNGEHAGSRGWEGLAPAAGDFLRGKTTDEAREWIASRLVDGGQAGREPDRAVLARSVLDPVAAFFIADIGGVFMLADADRIPDDAIEAARRIAACEGTSDPLREIAVDLSAERQAAIGSVTDSRPLSGAFPPVIVLDGNPESLSAELRKALPGIHDLLWEVHHPRTRIGSSGYAQLVDAFAIRNGEGASDYYFADAWLEQMSETGEPGLPKPDHAPGRGGDWYRVRPSILAVAAMIEEEANRAAPSFLQDQGQIGVEILPVSVWGQEDRRIRATFTGSDGEARDLRVVGAGTARWAAAAVRLACRRLEKSHRAVDRAGTVVSDLAAVMDIVQAARKEPLSQTAVRLEPADAPGVYVVDEPEAHLHPRAIASVRTWLEELARTATAVLAATHSPMLLDTDSSLATRVLVLPRDGGTELHALTGTMDDFLAETAGSWE